MSRSELHNWESARPEFDDWQMDEIRLGLMRGLDVSLYAKPEFDNVQMKQIRIGLVEGLDASVYAKPEFNWQQMARIRYGLKKGLDVSVYARPEFNIAQMEQIGIGLEGGLDVSLYARPEFDDWQMYEIRTGLEKDLDVSIYAKPEFYNWQMKQIRCGLEKALDVEKGEIIMKFSKENVWNNKKPSTNLIGFNIDDIDSLSETAALIFENKVGTAELFVGGKRYLVLQHDLNRSVKEQSFDVFCIEETLGKRVSFNDMIRMIKDDIAQDIQIGR